MEIGTVVKSLAGRDKGYLLTVVDVTEKGLLVCDGKERPLERPKLKNPRHVEATGQSLSSMASNRSLRKALRELY